MVVLTYFILRLLQHDARAAVGLVRADHGALLQHLEQLLGCGGVGRALLDELGVWGRVRLGFGLALG